MAGASGGGATGGEEGGGVEGGGAVRGRERGRVALEEVRILIGLEGPLIEGAFFIEGHEWDLINFWTGCNDARSRVKTGN